MKFPWDKNYLKISFHVIVTLVAAYVLIITVDAAAYTLSNFEEILSGITSFFSKALSMISPLLISFVIAYVLDPLVDFFQEKYEVYVKGRFFPFCLRQVRRIPIKKWNLPHFFHRKHVTGNSGDGESEPDEIKKTFKKRTAGAIIAYLAIILAITVAVLAVVSRLGKGKSEDFLQNISASMSKTALDLTEFYAEINVKLASYEMFENVSGILNEFVTWLTNSIKNLSVNIVPAAASIGSSIANFLIAFVVAFYFLRDKAMLKSKIDGFMTIFVPKKLNGRIYNICRDVHAVFSGYIRGQLTDALIMGVLLSTALSIVGVDFAVVIGILSGLANIIPYFGAIIAFVISVVVALVGGSFLKAVAAAIVILILQQVDGMFIVPRVVGKSVELSPLMVILSLGIAGNIFGIPGLIFAVPVCAILKIFITRYINRKKEEKKLAAEASSE